jgi:D-threo-aldose 1-dehydrogenase
MIPPMRTNRLGSTQVEVTEVGLGGGPLGNLFTPLDEATAEATLAAAWDGGIRYYDTAPHYGVGTSERRMGGALRERPRDAFTLSTKVGRILVPQDPAGRMDDPFAVPLTHERVWDFSRDGVRRSLEDSLERLGVDRVDVLLLHDAEPRLDWALREGFPALAELRAEGVVGAIGAGMGDSAKLARVVREADPDVLMMAGEYTLLQQPGLEDLLPLCAERGVSILAAAVFNSGILAEARPSAGARFAYEPAAAELVERANRIADVCEAHGVTLPQAAIAFPLRHPAIASVVLGMRSPEEVEANLAAHAAPVPDALWDDLRGAELLDPRTATA